MNDFFNVAVMTPVLHYTMGGLQIDPESRVIDGSGKPIPGLFASGEVAGGVHGANRLGGSSLLGCVVFGRVSGDSAAAYLLQATSAAVQKAGGRLAAVAGHVDPKPAAAEKKSQEKAVGSASKSYSAAEVAKHNKKEDIWVIVNDQVLDVTNVSASLTPFDVHQLTGPSLSSYPNTQGARKLSFSMLAAMRPRNLICCTTPRYDWRLVSLLLRLTC